MKVICNNCGCYIPQEKINNEMIKYRATNLRDLLSILGEEQKELVCEKCNEENKMKITYKNNKCYISGTYEGIFIETSNPVQKVAMAMFIAIVKGINEANKGE